MAKSTSSQAPAPRPALQRAADADVHPVAGRGLAPRPSLGRAPTSDALRGPAKDKWVDLAVRVPKSVRKRLRAEAKNREVTPDQLVATILSAALPRD